jgi:hypothetical protein
VLLLNLGLDLCQRLVLRLRWELVIALVAEGMCGLVGLLLQDFAEALDLGIQILRAVGRLGLGLQLRLVLERLVWVLLLVLMLMRLSVQQLGRRRGRIEGRVLVVGRRRGILRRHWSGARLGIHRPIYSRPHGTAESRRVDFSSLQARGGRCGSVGTGEQKGAFMLWFLYGATRRAI